MRDCGAGNDLSSWTTTAPMGTSQLRARVAPNGSLFHVEFVGHEIGWQSKHIRRQVATGQQELYGTTSLIRKCQKRFTWTCAPVWVDCRLELPVITCFRAASLISDGRNESVDCAHFPPRSTNVNTEHADRLAPVNGGPLDTGVPTHQAGSAASSNSNGLQRTIAVVQRTTPRLRVQLAEFHN